MTHSAGSLAFAGVGLLCLLGVAFLAQELTRVALELRNVDGTYTLGVGNLRLSGFTAFAIPLYWLGHLWIMVAVWRVVRYRRRLEAVVAAFLVVGILGIRFLLHSMPLKQMIIRPWII